MAAVSVARRGRRTELILLGLGTTSTSRRSGWRERTVRSGRCRPTRSPGSSVPASCATCWASCCSCWRATGTDAHHLAAPGRGAGDLPGVLSGVDGPPVPALRVDRRRAQPQRRARSRRPAANSLVWALVGASTKGGATADAGARLLRRSFLVLLTLLLLGLSWFWPWYVLWLLPCAALSTRRTVTVLVIAFTVRSFAIHP